jgi:hypothetical protein
MFVNINEKKKHEYKNFCTKLHPQFLNKNTSQASKLIARLVTITKPCPTPWP